jgi:mono/diheme cytochrome c family protein
MDVQPKYSADEASARFAGRQAALPKVAGTVPVSAVDEPPPARTVALLERGRERYAIYCAPCHGEYGDGDGRVVVRFGFPQPPSLHDAKRRAADDAHLLDVVTNGFGVMYPYSTVLPWRDRWAVIGYVRALQLARHVDVALYPEVRAELDEARP